MHACRTQLLSILIAAAVSVTTAWSQESRATVLGRVTDASGAVIPAAGITFLNQETGVTTRTETNQEGNYISAFLIPGTYRITAEKMGFKSLVRSRVTLSVNDRVELNLTLEVGSQAESVTVTADASLLDSANVAVGRVVSSEEVRNLPIHLGDVDNIIRLGNGVAFTDEPAKDQPWQPLNTAYSMAGSPSSRNEFTLDGASNTFHDEARSAVGQAWTPIADVVAEFKVQTATFDVSTGSTEGGVVNVSLKSGTNKIHGSAFFNKETASLDANSFFANAAGTPRANLNLTNPGGTVSGPVYIPKVYNGKNRTFFLFGYNWVKSIASGGTAGGIVATVPTAAERNGDFSALLKLGSVYQIYDPFSRTPAAGGLFQNQPLPGNIIPANQINSVAKNIVNYYPLPEQPGALNGTNNLDRTNWPSRVVYHSTVYKFDHNISDRNRVMFRVTTNRNDNHSVDYFGYDNPSVGALFYQKSIGFAFSENYSFSPTLNMDVRVSDASFVRAQGPNDAGRAFTLSSAGFPLYLQNALGPSQRNFPSFAIPGYTSLGDRAPLYKNTETRSAGVTLSKMRGAHQIKFGGEYRIDPENRAGVSPTNGNTPLAFSAPTAYTVGPLSNAAAAPIGQGLASFLYGIVGGSITVPSTTDFAEIDKSIAAFVQDDWKVTRTLNINLGLRYEFQTPLTERYNRSALGFDPTAAMPFAAQAQANYALNPTPEIPVAQFLPAGGLSFAGVGGKPRGLYNAPKTEFMPRVGFAYSPNSKTVIRGGIGIFYGSLGVRLQDAIQTGFNQATNVVASNDGGITFASSLSNPFPSGILQPTGASLGSLTYIGNSINFFNQDPRPPQLLKYQLDIQREFAGFVASAGYLGSRGANLEVSRSYKPFPNQYLSTSPVRDQATINYLSASLPSPFANIPIFAGTGLAGSVISRSALLSPYPQFSGIGYYTYDGQSWYDALNMKLEKRFSHGYLVSATYTFSKFLAANTLLNAGDTAPAKFLSPQDYPHHIAVSAVYELPIGKGRPLFPGIKGVPRLIIGDWNLSYVYTYQSGPPIAFGNVLLTGDPKSIGLDSAGRSAAQWFNVNAFNRVTAQQLANNLITLSPTFAGIRAAAYNSSDASLIKQVPIHESIRLEARIDSLNIFNQVSFGVPNTTPTSTAFGAVTTQKNVPRRLQATIRLTF
uniref:TonB-dependent transporter Oar-like beta-barrel domain-containing protein n=1 Tax=Solibacter usitatus (strain Ellin6076) TaxID=234267 RepID=Q022J6_SOLUE